MSNTQACRYIDKLRCLEKSSRGNVFDSRSKAKKAIRSTDRGRGQNHIIAFICRYCGRWHIGRPGKREAEGKKMIRSNLNNNVIWFPAGTYLHGETLLGGWYFWNESQLLGGGPYSKERDAIAALVEYEKTLEYEGGSV